MPPAAERRRFARAVKAVADRVIAAAALVAAAPVMALVAVAVRAGLGRPVLFRQARPGLGGRPFALVKFRTMRLGPGADGERLTRMGRFLRSCSLDELPELWNVLRGEMSLVGPRPLLTRYLDRYSPEQARRHEMRPGLTGWAQVHGRNALSWDERLALDVWYVDHWSLALDARIVARTLWTVLSRRGITAAGSDSMPEFRGGVVSP
jgi:lipopolysaccharide/colanic/teichoic acid biosynthesis glycosyltransferase